MNTTNYDLEIFDDLIGGSLCPENVNVTSTAQIVNYLNEHYGECKKLTVVSVKKRNQLYQVQKVIELTNAHPLINEYYSGQSVLFDWHQCNALAQDVIKKLNIGKEQIRYISSSNNHATKKITIEHVFDWKSLPYDQLKYYYFSTLLKKECESIRKRIQSNFFNLSDKQNTDFYIHKLQRYMIDLSFDLLKAYNFNLHTLSHSIKEEYTDEDIYTMVYLHVEELIAFIEKNYLQHLDQSVPVPFNSTLLSVYQLKEKMELIHDQLEKCQVDHELKNLIQRPIFKINSRSLDDRMTYRDLMYHIQFITKLHDLLTSENDITTNRLISFCFEVNYNEMKIMDYLIGKIQQQIEECASDDEVDELLRRELKFANQQQLYTRKSFSDRSQSLKTYITHWIEQEVLFLERNRNRQLVFQPTSTPSAEISRIDVNLSVPQLAFLFRLLSDTGIINANSKQDLMRSIAKTFSTSKVNSISVKSLHNSFYEQDNQTIEAIKHLLIKMLGEINAGKY